MKISFHGANRSVTGSCHLIECAGYKILIDCGLFQGGREIAEDNAEDFGFDPRDIDFLLLTHAHLDHCGRIPLLAKRGFKGEIISTVATRELARLVMLDSANLHEEDARYQAKKRARHGQKNKVKPLYSLVDALNGIGYFGRTARYNHRLKLGRGIHATFYDAGHILGSASVFLELEEDGRTRTLLFSGDLGNTGRPLLRDPEIPEARADIVVMETTYGDRLHKSLAPSVEELYDGINDTFQRGGNVVIPTFALERTQDLLFFLREGVESGRLPATTQVYLDSPMAISATEIFQRYPDCYHGEVAEMFHQGRDPFNLPGLHYSRESAESMAINKVGGGVVILAGSGMCTGGRIRHHLKHNLWRKESSVIFVGFASKGSLARQIIDGAEEVRIFGEEIPVQAKIFTIGGFSAHADQAELLEWHGKTGKPEVTFLVHGEEQAMSAFALLLKDTRVEMPEFGESFLI